MKISLFKKLLALTGLLFLLSTLITLPGGVQAAGYVPQNSNRKILNFNTNWLFAGDVPGANGQIVALNESGFVPVTLPYFRVHPHKAFPKSSFEVPVSWYRRHFSLPSTYAGRRIYVEFQAVAKVADVYVNGTFVGQHKGAYTPFTFDITNLVTLGGADNVIAVKVDSTTRNDIPPEGGSIDYYVWGGITRDVNLIITDPLHVDWAFITTPSVSTGSATVNARTNVRNDSSTSKSVTVITNIVDATNNVVATGTATATINANSAFEFNYNTSTVTNPNLWSTDNPYLYSVYTQIKDGANFVDEQKVRLGIRSIQFNATDGKFYLNGQWVKLRGLDRHESYPYIGRAAPNRLQAKDADMLKYELGVNMLRMSHYPQDPEFLERADEIGLLVLEEIPGWQFIGNTTWQDISVQNVQEMVMRDRNHPSIIIWGVRINESGDNSTFYTRTNNLARQLDPSRPTGGVRNFTGSQFLEDVYTYNDFSGGAINPTVLPWLITESVGHTHPDRASSPESTLIDTMVTHLNVQNQAAQKTNISGALGWVFADYNTTFTGSNSCDEYTCFHGVYDIFRLPKFSASVFASQRDPTRYGPYVSINNYHQSTSGTTVYVASNCNQVELFANGVSQGRINPNAYTSLPHPFFQFNNVTTASGSLRADCWIGSSIAATTTQFTPGTATKLVLTPDDTTLVADGADMTRVVVKALDSNNQVVPYNTAKVTFSITGPGAVVGESPLLLEAGRGAVYIKAALGQTGSVTLSASASGLTGASTNVTINSFTTEIVPTSGSYSFGFVNDVNDLDEGTGSNLFNYAGAWSHGSGSGGLFNGDNSWSSTTNDSATLAFNGTRVVLYGVLDTTHGTGAISIDGGAETNVSFNGTRRGNVALWGSATLSQGAHTLRVRVTGNGPISIDRAMVVSNPPVIIGPPPSSIISVNDNTLGTGQEQFEYVGTWSYGNQSGAYQGDNHWSNAVNAYYQVRFTGAQVRLYAAKDPAHGIIGVSIDGGAETNVDLYASTRADQVLVWTSPVLAAGSHTLKVRVTGNKNASSTNTFAIGDRVDIIPSSGPTPTPTPTNTPGPTPTRTNTPVATSTPTNTPSGVTYYRLIARHSSKCLEVPNSSTADGIQLDQFTCSGGTNQQWQFSPVGSFYNIINRNSGKCMDVSGVSTADGAQVIQWTCGSGTNQQWTLSDLGTGYYQLIARHSGKCLDVNAASLADGALIIQWTCGSGTNQQWQRQ